MRLVMWCNILVQAPCLWRLTSQIRVQLQGSLCGILGGGNVSEIGFPPSFSLVPHCQFQCPSIFRRMGNDPTRVYISTETCYRVANNTRPYEWPNIINRPVHSCCFNKGGSTIDSTTLQSAYDTFYYRQSGRSLICGSVTKNCPGVVKGYHEKKIVIKRSLWFEIQTWFS